MSLDPLTPSWFRQWASHSFEKASQSIKNIKITSIFYSCKQGLSTIGKKLYFVTYRCKEPAAIQFLKQVRLLQHIEFSPEIKKDLFENEHAYFEPWQYEVLADPQFSKLAKKLHTCKTDQEVLEINQKLITLINTYTVFSAEKGFPLRVMLIAQADNPYLLTDDFAIHTPELHGFAASAEVWKDIKENYLPLPKEKKSEIISKMSPEAQAIANTPRFIFLASRLSKVSLSNLEAFSKIEKTLQKLSHNDEKLKTELRMLLLLKTNSRLFSSRAFEEYMKANHIEQFSKSAHQLRQQE